MPKFSETPRAPSLSNHSLERQSEQGMPSNAPILGDFFDFQGRALGNTWTTSVSHLPSPISHLPPIFDLCLSPVWCHQLHATGESVYGKKQPKTRLFWTLQEKILSLIEANFQWIPTVSFHKELEHAQRRGKLGKKGMKIVFPVVGTSFSPSPRLSGCGCGMWRSRVR